ncbi:hypothetical protein JCM8097_000128 [Rhodosporidiobolus ruineniae]
MTPPTSGACCVCGQETTRRCSACGKAGLSLYFCSSEHQKLVWFAYKQVCGPTAKPFAFPPLSKEEVQEAKTGMHIPFLVSGGGTTTHSDGLIDSCISINPLWFLKFSLATLLDSLQVDQPSSPLFTFDQRNELICRTRAAVHSLRLRDFPGLVTPEGSYGPAHDFPPTEMHPVVASCRFASLLAPALLKRSREVFPAHEDWYIKLLHSLWILYALRHLQHREVVQHPPASIPKSAALRSNHLEPYVLSCRRRLYELARDIKATDKVAGEVVLENLPSRAI